MTITTTGPEPATRRLARTMLTLLSRAERRLRPDDGSFIDPEAVTSATASRPRRHDDTAELLRPDSLEPKAVRARRQARAYLKHRRERLAQDLDERR